MWFIHFNTLIMNTKKVGYGYLIFTLIASAALAVLKLTGHIGWSWIWIAAPIWGSFVAALSVLAFCYVLLMVFGYGK